MTDATTSEPALAAPGAEAERGRAGGGLVSALVRLAQDAPVPDFVARLAIERLVAGARRSLEGAPPDAGQRFAEAMADRPIATHVEDANAQHYELPAAFFEAVLGPHLKYSSGFYPPGARALAEGEVAALRETEVHADLRDGQSVLELGCGWGSLSLWMAERFPNSTITAVSNSASQKAFIDRRAAQRGLSNLTVVTADMNAFEAGRLFDRVVSVEMFEHMSNWRALLTRVRTWLAPDGLLFLHVFTHAATPYRFETDDPDDWIARYFFSGGIMPSHDLAGQFPDLFEVAMDWRWSGEHYARTARQWLERFDAARATIDPILVEVYGDRAAVWRRRWRLFFLATAGLFGHRGGRDWGVSHYRLRPVA